MTLGWLDSFLQGVIGHDVWGRCVQCRKHRRLETCRRLPLTTLFMQTVYIDLMKNPCTHVSKSYVKCTCTDRTNVIWSYETVQGNVNVHIDDCQQCGNIRRDCFVSELVWFWWNFCCGSTSEQQMKQANKNGNNFYSMLNSYCDSCNCSLG